jgi:hypothetical protein
MKNTKQINVRDFQHNLSMYMGMAELAPLSITKNGIEKAVLVNPKKYSIKKKSKKPTAGPESIMGSAFIGMYKNRKDWKNKSNAKISKELREKAWYGK